MKKAINASVEELIKDIDQQLNISFSSGDDMFFVQDPNGIMPSGGCGGTLYEALIAYGRIYWSELKGLDEVSKNLDWSDLV